MGGSEHQRPVLRARLSLLLAAAWLAGCALPGGAHTTALPRSAGDSNARWLAACAADPSLPSCPSNPAAYAALGGAEVLDPSASSIEARAERAFALGEPLPDTAAQAAPAAAPAAGPAGGGPGRPELSSRTRDGGGGAPAGASAKQVAAAKPQGTGQGPVKTSTRVPQQTVYQGVEITVVSGTTEGVLPGAVLMLSLQVRNSTVQPMQLIESLRLPDGWRLLQPTDRFLLSGSATHLALLAISLPRTAPAGVEELVYDLRESGGNLRGSISIPVEVLAVDDLVVLVESRPELVVAGESYRARFRVVNQGNAAVMLDLEATATGDRAELRLEPEKAYLEPGASRLVVAQVATFAKRSRAESLGIKLEATPRGKEKGAAAFALTELVPAGASAVDLRHRFPVSIGGGVYLDRGERGAFGEIRGAGHLTDGGSGFVDFLFRGPDSERLGAFGLREALRASYHDDSFDVRAGDHTYGLSYLTSPLRYGRGGEVVARMFDGAEVGAFVTKSRWEEPEKHQLGAHVGYRMRDMIVDELDVRGNFLSTGGASLRGLGNNDDRVASLASRLRWNKRLDAAVEAGFSRAGEDGAMDWAIHASASGKLPLDVAYGLMHAYGAPDYRGTLGDSQTTSASMNVPLWKWLTARASYQQHRSNLRLDAERLTAPDNEILEAGINALLARHVRVYAAYAQARLEDRLGATAGRGPEHAAKVNAGYSSGSTSISVDARLGTVESTTTGERVFMHGYQGSLSYASRKRLRLTAFGGWGSSDSASSYIAGAGGAFVGGSLSWNQSKRLRADASWYSRGGDLSRHHGRVRGRYLFDNGSEFLLEARYQTPTGEDRELDSFSVLLSFSVSMGIPVGYKKGVGTVQGLLFDTATPGSPGLARVVVRINGSSATTDRRGRFVFPALEPGDYILKVDPSTLPNGAVPTTKLPRAVRVEGGKKTRVEIGFTRAVSISGAVVVVPRRSDDSAASDHKREYVLADGTESDKPDRRGLRGMLVEVSQGEEVRRTLTDENGQFLFQELVPGTWKLRVFESNLPPYHDLQNPTEELELEPGKSASLQIDVVPHRRQIRFVASGTAE